MYKKGVLDVKEMKSCQTDYQLFAKLNICIVGLSQLVRGQNDGFDEIQTALEMV